MEIVPFKESFTINNIDNLTVDKIRSDDGKHGALLPDTIRCIVSGPSNCGKTNVVFNLITSPNGVRFNNLYIFSKSLQQPKYQLLRRIISLIPDVNLYEYDDNEKVMQPNEAKPHSVFIFDDISCENHQTIRNYFAMGRHYQIDSIYIGQTYSKIPKQLIRDNVNLLILFKQDETNLKHVYSDHVGVDTSYNTFKEMCGKAWEENFGFVVIDKDRELKHGRYRVGFDRFVLIQ